MAKSVVVNMKQNFLIVAVAAAFGAVFAYITRDWEPPVVEHPQVVAAPELAIVIPEDLNAPLLGLAPSKEERDSYNERHIVLPDGGPGGPGGSGGSAGSPDYDHLSQNELKRLSFNDQIAALVLARRATDPPERLNWYLRAVGLSGKTGPLLELATEHYSDPGWGTAGVTETRIDSLKSRLVLEVVADRMGDPRARPEAWRAHLQGLQPNANLDWLDQKVEDILTHMSIIQRHAKGEGTIQALLD